MQDVTFEGREKQARMFYKFYFPYKLCVRVLELSYLVSPSLIRAMCPTSGIADTGPHREPCWVTHNSVLKLPTERGQI